MVRPLTGAQFDVDSDGLSNVVRTSKSGVDAMANDATSGSNQPLKVPAHHVPHGWLPSRSTFVFFLVALHLGALCYWCYLMYLAHRRAKLAAANRVEPRTPPPKVNCTYDWTSPDSDPESKSFFSRFRFRPFLEKKNSGRAVHRSELAAMGILGTGLPSRPRITRTPTLPSTPELV